MQQAEQLKINVSNIRSSLLIGTKRTQVLKIRKEKLLDDIEQKKLIQQEEKNLEQTKKPKKIGVLKSPVKKVANVFDNIMKFGAIVLTGILVNALPKMMDTIKKVFNSISGFFSRVFNFFKPFISFVTGIEFDDKEQQNKKLIDDAENLKKQLKPLDALTNKVGKLTGDFNKAAEKSGVSTGGGGSGTSMGNELLDDYEEGSFTGGFNDFNGSYSQNTGQYVKIGNFVCATIMLQGSGGSGSGDLKLTNLPFVSDGVTIGSLYRSVGNVFAYQGLVTGGLEISAVITNNTSHAILTGTNNNAVATTLNRNGLNSNAWEVQITVTYHTNS